MTEEWRRKLTDWASEWLDPGEEVRAIVVCIEPSARVLAFPLHDDRLDPPRDSIPLGPKAVRVRRGLFGSKVLLGRLDFNLPRGTRDDALSVAAAAAGPP